MGEVWEASHVVTGRPVAVKRLRRPLDAEPDERARARFVLEAQAACAVEHPNVVEILDFVESPGEAPLIIMELLRGETLAAKLTRVQALSVEETARIILPVISAVGTAHSRGIVHRDLKPANIFLDENLGELLVKVLDFGIAKWVAPRPGAEALHTETGSTLGTPSYMAPEQALGERFIDHRADIWALGVILYECLSGARPVEGENAARMMVRLLSTGIIPIERLVPDLPGELAALIGRMLSRDVERRPADLREVAAVLTPLADRKAPSFGAPVAPVTPPPKAREVVARRVPAPVRYTAVALVAALGVSLWRARDDAPSDSSTATPIEASGQATVAAAPSAPSLARTASGTPPQMATTPKPSATTPKTAKPSFAGRLSSRGAARSDSSATGAVAQPGLAAGRPCELSSDCASKVCLALTCQ